MSKLSWCRFPSLAAEMSFTEKHVWSMSNALDHSASVHIVEFVSGTQGRISFVWHGQFQVGCDAVVYLFDEFVESG